MTAPDIDQQRRDGARLGPAMALRTRTASDRRERLVQRPRPAVPGPASSDEWAELERRRAELERLERG